MSRIDHSVNIHFLQPLLYLGHNLWPSNALQIDDVHRSAGLPPHHLLLDPQMGASEPAAHQAGVGAHPFHKGVFPRLSRRLVLRVTNGAFFLRGHAAFQGSVQPLEPQHHRPLHQGKHRLIGAFYLAYRQVVKRPRCQQPETPLQVGLSQSLILGQRAQDIIVYPLRAHHPIHRAQSHHPRRISRQAKFPGSKVHTALKRILQRRGAERHVKHRLRPGVGSARRPFTSKNAHDNSPHLR